TFFHPPFGRVEGLAVCRDGVRSISADFLSPTTEAAFADLRIRRHLNDARSRGICGLLPADAFTDGTVRPHEQTLENRLIRQEKLVLEDRGALGKPILLTIPHLTTWWEESDQGHQVSAEEVNFAGKDNDYQLRLFRARKGATEPISLAELGPICIADGHHRAATHARLAARGVAECAFIPVCLIGAEALHIGTFLRIIEGPQLPKLLIQLSNFFIIELLDQPLGPTQVGEWLLVHRGQFFRLRRKENEGHRTDIRWLEDEVLPPLFGITNTRTDDRISFEPIADTPGEALEYPWTLERTYLCGFPLPKERFFQEVAAGKLLPPKSTRFEPRVPSGMVVWMP
ncbi:MAG: DUF1015 family protein, partial [Bacteroidota bacterium]